MFRFAPYVLKSLWGHGSRSALTISGAGVAIFVFCFVGSVQEGLRRLTSDESAQRTLVVFQENRFCPTSSKLPQDYERQIRQISGVKDVMPVQVWTNNCRASLDIVVFNGAPPEQLRKMRDLTLVSGDWSAFAGERDAAIVGRSVAQRRGIDVGKTFTIGDMSVQVAGIFASSVAAEENLIYTSLEYLQYSFGDERVGLVTQLEVALVESADADAVAREIDEKLRSGPVATTTRTRGAFQASTLADLVDLIGFAHWLGFACVGLVFALVAATTVMSVQDRVKEHAVLQTLGLRPSRVFRLIVSESLILCLAGGIVGTAAATLLLGWGGFAIGAEGATIAFRPSFSLAGLGVGVSLFVGLVAGFLPALGAARTPIVQALRQG